MPQDDLSRLKDSNDVVNKWWHWIRPYWHILSFFIIITYISTTKWNGMEANGDALAQASALHDKRITSLEVWQATISPAIARIEQKVDDIHDQIVP